MSSPTKSTTAVLGTYGSPATIAHGGTPVNSSAFNLATDFGACFLWQVVVTSAPTSATTIQPQVSDDGTHWTNDGGAFSAGITASTTYSGTYQPPDDALYARLQFVNADSSVDVTAVSYAMATTAVS
jgi:hypothetical protein